MSRIFLAGLLGGIGMFFWTFAAYTLLPLGNIGIRSLPDEAAVLRVLQHSIAEHSGAYLFPGFRQSSNPSDKKAEGAGDPSLSATDDLPAPRRRSASPSRSSRPSFARAPVSRSVM